MRNSRFTAVAVCSVTFAAGVVTAAPAHAATVRYVALGDSYSSGQGAGGYDSASGSCSRSKNAYPKRWANAHSPASFSFAACSGAKTTDVIGKQLGTLSASTTLVSITIGGNDAGFGKVMQTCVLGSDVECVSAVTTAKTYMTQQLPGRLAAVYAAIKSKAPAAQVVVLGYPRLYIITSYCLGLSNTKRTALNGAADQLDTVIGKAATTAGLTYADPRSTFSGHELCSGDGWLHSVTYPIGDSYHPTSLGHASGYLPVLTTAVKAAASKVSAAA